MKILIGCEESQTVCKAFRAKGHEAYSNDIINCSGGHPEWHLKMDVFEAIKLMDWDMGIFFPPCTDLAVSGSRWFAEKQDGRQQASIDFFLRLTELGFLWAIENPIGIMSTHYKKPDQIIQPWMFGHKETKATCIWLNGLPGLIPTDMVGPPPKDKEERKSWEKIWRMPPSEDRAKLRSKTYQGIAEAMANQYSLFMQSGLSTYEWEDFLSKNPLYLQNGKNIF